MKYTFEIMKEYEDAFKGISVYSVSEDKKLMVDFVAREELEDAQKQVDEAYQKGYDKGYADKTNNDEVCEELAKDIYQRGLDAAWEAARKIARMWEEDTDTEHRVVIDDSIRVTLDSMTASEAIEKLKAYEEQKATDDIKVGDEVIDTQSGARFCVTHFWVNNHGEKGVSGFNHECSAFQDTNDKVKKTGRHFDIEKILEEMKE